MENQPWTDWIPVILQGHTLSYHIDSSQYIILANWATIRGQLTFESAGLPSEPVQAHNLPETIKGWLAFGDCMFTCSGLHYPQGVWSTGNGILSFGQFGDTPDLFGQKPAIAIKPGDTLRFQAFLGKKEAEPHPAIPRKLYL